MRVVEGVEEFRAEFNRPLFVNGELFEKRQVEVNHTWPTRVTLAGVTEGELRGRSETACVEPSIDGLWQADVGACQVGVIAGGRVQLRSREGDHERRAAADVGDSVDLPAADDEIRNARYGAQEFPPLAEGQLVEVTRCEDVRDVGRLARTHTAIERVVIRPDDVRVVYRLRPGVRDQRLQARRETL